MQIVIEISKGDYDWIKQTSEGTTCFPCTLRVYKAIANGIQLPEGHGRLIDADALLEKHPEFDTYPFPSTTIDNALTIIPADMEGE